MAKRSNRSKPVVPAAASGDAAPASDAEAGDAATAREANGGDASPAAAKPASASSKTAATAKTEAPAPPDPATASTTGDLARRHLGFGWGALAVFTLLGLLLEAAHGLKLGWYLDITSATRRLSLTLAHAHGTLLGLVNIGFAASLSRVALSEVALGRVSFGLRAVTVLMPLGFLLGGLSFYAGDPGIGIALVPPSGALLVVVLAVIARGSSGRR